MKENLLVLFSGGRTSGYMSKWIKDNWSHLYNIKYAFANTGCEDIKTLEFVHLCDTEMNLELTWIEAVTGEKGKGTNYKVVDYHTASRDGSPFEDVISKYGLPNNDFPHCTRELKIEPMKKWANDAFNGEPYKMALGIRVDEPARLTQAKGQSEKLYPLAHDKPMTKGDILLWWKNQHFDLQVSEHLGNCTWCWKKSDTKLLTIARERPEVFDFPKRMEEKYSETSNYERKDKRIMFRGYKTVDDILELSKDKSRKSFIESYILQPSLDLFYDTDRCPEECGSVWNV